MFCSERKHRFNSFTQNGNETLIASARVFVQQSHSTLLATTYLLCSLVPLKQNSRSAFWEGSLDSSCRVSQSACLCWLLQLHVCRHYKPLCQAQLACLHLQPHLECYYYFYASALLRSIFSLAQTMGTAPEGDHRLQDDEWVRRGADVLPAIPACWLIPQTTLTFHRTLKLTCHCWCLKGSAFCNQRNIAGGWYNCSGVF